MRILIRLRVSVSSAVQSLQARNKHHTDAPWGKVTAARLPGDDRPGELRQRDRQVAA